VQLPPALGCGCAPVCAALRLVGKLPRRRRQLVAPLLSGGPLIFLRDFLSGRSFLVDTGASRSLIPHWSRRPATGPRLEGADGQVIRSWLTSDTCVSFGGSSFSFPFLHAAVTRPILGADFLAAHGLLVDPANKRVLVAETLLPLGRSGGRGGMVAALTDADPSVRRLLSSFPRIQHLDLRSHLPLHGVEHTIEVMGRPVFSKARRLDPVKLKIAEAEFRSLEAAGIVRRSKSPWAAPLHMVPKPDGSWRPCGDYRRLNLLTVHDRYPLPNILDFSANLSGCTVFSTIDLVKGYHQVPMATADVEKTAIITPFGLFEYIKMPFGLRNSAQTFQRLMDHLFRLLGFAFTYIDDILVASRSAAEHQLHLRQIFYCSLRQRYGAESC